MIDDRLVTYVKEGLEKGYAEEQLKNAMLAQNIPLEQVDEAFNFIRLERRKPIRDHYIIVVVAGILALLIMYLSRVLLNPPPTEGGLAGKIFRGFWPFLFPISANLINFFFYRRSFVKGLLLTGIILVFMILVVVGFAFLGFATAVQ